MIRKKYYIRNIKNYKRVYHLTRFFYQKVPFFHTSLNYSLAIVIKVTVDYSKIQLFVSFEFLTYDKTSLNAAQFFFFLQLQDCTNDIIANWLYSLAHLVHMIFVFFLFFFSLNSNCLFFVLFWPLSKNFHYVFNDKWTIRRERRKKKREKKKS